MPVNKHLKYQDITDFSPGLFTDGTAATAVLAPAMAAQQMDDVYAQPQGGIRAFFTSTSLTVTGIVHPTQEECTGIFAVGGYSRRSGTGGQGANGKGVVYYMTTWNQTTNVASFYRMDTTGGQATWDHVHDSAATADAAGSRYQSSFQHFVDISGNDYVIVVLRSSVDRGLYKWFYDASQADSNGGTDNALTKINAHDGALAVAQARIVVGSHETGDDQKMYWTGVGSTVFSGVTSGSLVPAPSAPRNAVTLMQSMDPDQILLGFRGAPWVTITGDINSASSAVRAMGEGHFPDLQDGVRTPGGIVFMTNHGPAYQTDGRTFTNITPLLTGFSNANANFGGLGTGTFAEGFLFLPDSLVMFEESKGWFKVSDQVGAYIFSDPGIGVIAASSGVSFTLTVRGVSRSLGTRVSAWTWRSAPFAQPDETQTEVREVTLQGVTYTASTYTVTVTDHLGNTQVVTTASIPTGKHNIAVPTCLRGDYCDVKVVATATNGTGEAPTLEKIRLGFGMGHSL